MKKAGSLPIWEGLFGWWVGSNGGGWGLATMGPPLLGSGSGLKLKRRSLWGKGRNFAWGPGSLEIGRRWGGGEEGVRRGDQLGKWANP